MTKKSSPRSRGGNDAQGTRSSRAGQAVRRAETQARAGRHRPGRVQSALMKEYSLAGQAAELQEIQAALPASTAFVAWVDIQPAGPNAADPSGEHWAVVVRSRGTRPGSHSAAPAKTASGRPTTPGSRTELAGNCGCPPAPSRPTCGPYSRGCASRRRAFGQGPGRHGRRPAPGPQLDRASIACPDGHSGRSAGRRRRRAHDQLRTVGHSVQVLGNKPRPEGPAGLLALGDPAFAHFDPSRGPEPLPEKGLLLNVVVRGFKRGQPRPQGRRCLACLQRRSAQ